MHGRFFLGDYTFWNHSYNAQQWSFRRLNRKIYRQGYRKGQSHYWGERCPLRWYSIPSFNFSLRRFTNRKYRHEPEKFLFPRFVAVFLRNMVEMVWSNMTKEIKGCSDMKRSIRWSQWIEYVTCYRWEEYYRNLYRLK